MSPQIARMRGCIITLVALVGLFSSVCFQMCPQIACMRGCIVALVAFVWLFSTVRFEMSPQCTWIRACIVTLAACVWLFSTVCFQMCLQMTCLRRGIVALVTFVWFYYFIICVSQGNIYIDPTFTKVIIYNILTHHIQFGILSCANCQFETEKMRIVDKKR